ncbi:MAG: DUF177 domain-containing protein [Saprospiraceae bacterium]|nr:DUF177 domain-containing protein [Saprospiraceae bacterium]
MNVLDHFSVPYKGLGNGVHQLNFTVDDAFFKEFEDSHIDNGDFEVNVELDKRHDHSILIFDIEGNTKTNCDRCLSQIHLPVTGNFKLHVKHGEQDGSNDEILFIHPETSILNLAQVIYEFVLLSIPLIKVYDCLEDEQPPCNEEVLEKLNEEDDIEEPDQNTVWDSLKDLDL